MQMVCPSSQINFRKHGVKEECFRLEYITLPEKKWRFEGKVIFIHNSGREDFQHKVERRWMPEKVLKNEGFKILMMRYFRLKAGDTLP